MSLPFPERHVGETDSVYRRLPHHVFVMKPSPQGTDMKEFRGLVEDFKHGIVAKSLLENETIPHHSLGGQELSLQSLKEMVTNILIASSIEWIRGCVGVCIMYHPEQRGKLISLLSRLVDSGGPPGEKLLGVSHGNEAFAFKVKRHEARLMPTDSMFIWLENPSDPVAEIIVPSDRRGPLTLTTIYESKQKVENFAMVSLCTHLVAEGDTTPDELSFRYEPLGNAFPDFELLVRDQEWAVEITRIETGMVSYLRVSEPMEKHSFDKAAQRQVTESGIIEALTKAIDDKTRIREECSRYSRACLLLVDVVDYVDEVSPDVWSGLDLSAFNVVALVKLDGRVNFIKGTHAFGSVW